MNRSQRARVTSEPDGAIQQRWMTWVAPSVPLEGRLAADREEVSTEVPEQGLARVEAVRSSHSDDALARAGAAGIPCRAHNGWLWS